MERPRARNSDDLEAICAPRDEFAPRARKSRLVGTVCALEDVRGRGSEEIDRLAVLQQGCAHREQLLVAGIGPGAIKHRLKTQRYLLLHRAVYLIDPARAGEWTATMAAVLHFAGDGLVAVRSAGALWQLLDEMPDLPEVTVVGRGAHPVRGLTIHRVASIDPRDVAWRHGMPVTSVARTIVDLAGVLTALELESVIATALKLRLTTIQKIREAIGRSPRCRGRAILCHLLDQGGLARTRSGYERRMLSLIAAAGLPRPLTNHLVAGHEVDMLWPDRKLVLEFDGFKFHSDRRAFERDRRRDQDLVAAGYRVIRITARQVEEEPLALIARLATALAV